MDKRIIYVLILVFLLKGCVGLDAGNVIEIEEPNIIDEIQDEQLAERYISPRTGGTLRLAMRYPSTLNPLLNKDENVDKILKLIFEPLAKLDENQRIVPNLADTIEIFESENGLNSILIVLKDNLRWHDDVEITANDVEFSLNTLMQADEDVIYKQVVNNIASYQIIDTKTIQIYFHDKSIANKYAMLFPIIPRHHYSTNTNMANMDKNPLGSGLYMLEDYAVADSLLLTSARSAFNEVPYIENVLVKIIPDRQTDLHAFEQSVIDVISSEVLDRGKYLASNTVNVHEYITMYYEFIGFNFNKEMFGNMDVRQAIASTISIDNIISEVYVGHAVKADSPINPMSWLYEPEVSRNMKTIDEAREIIDAIEDKPEQMIIITNEENAERIKIADILKDSLQQIGIDAVVEVMPFEDFYDRLIQSDFDMFVGGFSLSTVPDLSFAFHSTGSHNYSGLNDPTMDMLLESVASATSEADMQRTLSDFQKYFVFTQPNISIAFKKWALLTDDKIHGNLEPNFMNIYNNIGEWFIYEE